MSPIVTVSRFIGCDVGKATIAVHDAAAPRSWEIDNAPASLAAFAAALDPTCLVVCEATGGYEAALLSALLARRIPAHRADARKVKAFIKSYGVLGKSDAIDAKWLARYGHERDAALPRWRAPDKARATLQALVLARQDLVAARAAFHNRSQAPTCVTTVHADLVKAIDCAIARLDTDIAGLLSQGSELAGEVELLRKIKGFGKTNAPAIIALMPELGSLDRRKVAALAGLAPHPRQSGARDAYRATRGGRPAAKRALFMAALVAARHNPQIKTFFNRLLANGKKPIVAITAVMRKLLVIANAKIRDHRAQTSSQQVS
ncbi:IS110 family transposase [Streptomyces sp. NPDC020681]|uniref:IS110 family transposase n=1 Tax=Streptomyces sp. NPDC020681 TaxID=3365083 RepID=UPI0037B9DA05